MTYTHTLVFSGNKLPTKFFHVQLRIGMSSTQLNPVGRRAGRAAAKIDFNCQRYGQTELDGATEAWRRKQLCTKASTVRAGGDSDRADSAHGLDRSGSDDDQSGGTTAANEQPPGEMVVAHLDPPASEQRNERNTSGRGDGHDQPLPTQRAPKLLQPFDELLARSVGGRGRGGRNFTTPRRARPQPLLTDMSVETNRPESPPVEYQPMSPDYANLGANEGEVAREKEINLLTVDPETTSSTSIAQTVLRRQEEMIRGKLKTVRLIEKRRMESDLRRNEGRDAQLTAARQKMLSGSQQRMGRRIRSTSVPEAAKRKSQLLATAALMKIRAGMMKKANEDEVASEQARSCHSDSAATAGSEENSQRRSSMLEGS